MRYLKLVLPAIFLALSSNVNAVIVNTLNDNQYEWLELTETVGLNRKQVDDLLTESTSSLYGYRYASRSLVQDLFLSYASWDGLNGYHDDVDVVSGVSSLFNDFGTTQSVDYGNIYKGTMVDGDIVEYTGSSILHGLMGTSSECGLESCRALVYLYNNNGTDVFTHQASNYGWDSKFSSPLRINTDYKHLNLGSFLVRDAIMPSTVPVPAAAWLFGSALLGFFGFSRRKANA